MRTPSIYRYGILSSNAMLHLLIIAILGLLVYSNTFHSPFQWDEAEFITSNPAIRDLASFLDPSQGVPMSAYSIKNRYLVYLTFALNYRFGGFDVLGYHIVNLAIHLVNSMLVYLLVTLTFRTPYFMATGEWQKAKSDGEEGNQARLAPKYHSEILYPSLFTDHYSRFFAFAVALLFVAHPVQTEAVTYVFQRSASLVAMFYLLSLVLYIKGRLITAEARGNGQEATGKKEVREKLTLPAVSASSHRLLPIAFFCLSLFFVVCAMKTKENAFTLPVMIALYEFLFFAGPLKSRVLRLLPFILTMLIIPVTILGIEGSLGEIAKPMTESASLGYKNLSVPEYFFTQLRAIVTYIRLLFLPIRQNLVYDYPVYHTLLTLPVLLSALFLMALFGMGVYLVYKSTQKAAGQGRRGQSEMQNAADYDSLPIACRFSPIAFYCRLIGFGILWFFITLSVESSVIPLAMVIDEYRVYLPSVGFFIALAGAAGLLMQRFPRVSSKEVVAVFMIVILGLSSATYARNALWSQKISLWEDVLSKNTSSPNVYNNLGIAYYEKGLYEKAIEIYSRAILLSPDNFFAYSNLGIAYASSGRIDLAIENLEKAAEKAPRKGVIYANLARAYRMRGDMDRAVENYIRAVTLNPFDGMAFYGLGSAYLTMGRLDDALGAYNKFVMLSPRDPEAYKNRGIAYARKGDMRSASADFREACALGSTEGCSYLQKVSSR